MKIAIHYTAVKEPSQTGQIYGLQVAVLDWLSAYFRYGRQEKFVFLIDSESARDEILETAALAGVELSRLEFLDSRFPQNFIGIDHVFRADPDSHDVLWQRNLQPRAAFSFCGLSHAIAGRAAGEILSSYCQAPVTQADAILCPSSSVQGVIRAYWDHYAAFLFARFGVKETCPVRLPVLPLGVDTARIEARCSPEKRASARRILDLKDDDVAVLWVGRLSHAIKAHPLAMFRAVEDAARLSRKSIRFFMQGYFVPEEAREEFAALAQTVCQTVRVDFIAADDPRFPDGLWAAGDIFLSLIDNMQESFGLTPIEAIAADLPRVLSDWDGYRDHATDGEDGFLVPTAQPPAGMGETLASIALGNRESYGGCLAKTAQCVAIDHEAAARAIARLASDPTLRARMAERARTRLARYAWERLIPAYEEEWALCVALRERNPLRRLPLAHPHAPDPFSAYAGFASRPLGAQDRFGLGLAPEAINVLLRHKMNTLAADMMIDMKTLPQLLCALNHPDGLDFNALAAFFPEATPDRLWRTLAWLIKLGAVTRFQ